MTVAELMAYLEKVPRDYKIRFVIWQWETGVLGQGSDVDLYTNDEKKDLLFEVLADLT